MSMLNASAAYRREERASLRVPVVMPLIEVTIDQDGFLYVALDREPYSAEGALQRSDLSGLLDDIVSDLGMPVRVQISEPDGSSFTDIVAPKPHTEQAASQQVAPSLPGEVTGSGFLPHENVAIAVVVAHQVAGDDGIARLRLPPALLEAHPGIVLLLGQSSGTITVSGGDA